MDLHVGSVVRRFVGFVEFHLPIAFKAVPVICYYILRHKDMTGHNSTTCIFIIQVARELF